MQDSSQGIGWRITAVHDDSRFIPNQAPQRLKRIHFELEDGTSSHVTVPEQNFNTQTVQAAVHQAATQLAGVLAMSGNVPFTDMVPNYNTEDVPY